MVTSTCPYSNNHCKPKHIIRIGKDFTCVGITSKPIKYKHDKVKLCLNGLYSKYSLEMTEYEARDIRFLLGVALWGE
jgi:hypothetical protein